MPEDYPIDKQAGVVIGDFVSDSNPRVAHGGRRGEIHDERDADQLTRVSRLVAPEVLPPDEATRTAPQASATAGHDVGVAPPQPSVWDAAPDDEGERHGR